MCSIPHSSSHGSQPSAVSSYGSSKKSISSASTGIRALLNSQGSVGSVRCVLEETEEGEFLIRTESPLFAAAGSGRVIARAILPYDYIDLLQQLPVLDPSGTDLSTRLRTLYIPTPEHYALPLFDSAPSHQLDVHWAVLTSRAYRPNDDWSPNYPQGYTLPASCSDFTDYYDYSINEILYPADAPASSLAGLPRFVLLIGRVCAQRRSDQGLYYQQQQQPKRSPPTSVTSYLIVMDIALPAKPLWLVHDAYTTSDDLDDGQLPAERQAPPGLSFAGDRTFDVAPLAASVGEWGWGSGDHGDGAGAGDTGGCGDGLTLDRARDQIVTAGRVVSPLISITWHSRVVQAVRTGYARK